MPSRSLYQVYFASFYSSIGPYYKFKDEPFYPQNKLCDIPDSNDKNVSVWNQTEICYGDGRCSSSDTSICELCPHYGHTVHAQPVRHVVVIASLRLT